jgi:hypothetical protein
MPELRGRGRKGHLIGLTGLLELLTIIELRGAGVSLQAIARAIENLRNISGESRPMAKFILVVRGKDIVWSDEDSLASMTFSALRSPGQRLLVFPIGRQHAEIAQHMRKNPSPSAFPSLLVLESNKEPSATHGNDTA